MFPCKWIKLINCGTNNNNPKITVIIVFFFESINPTIPANTWNAAPAYVATKIPSAAYAETPMLDSSYSPIKKYVRQIDKAPSTIWIKLAKRKCFVPFLIIYPTF